MKYLVTLAPSAAFLLLAACSAPADAPAAPAQKPAPKPAATGPTGTRSVNTIKIHDVDRSYILRLPPKYDEKTKLPLVMLLNGANDSAAYAEKAYHFEEKGDAENFILLLPDALGAGHVWDTGAGTREFPNDDLEFLTTLLQTLPKKYAIDTTRMYIAGHSVGAAMTFRVATEHPELVAAVATVAGAVSSTMPQPKLPVPVIAFHGLIDPIIPYGEAATGTVAEVLTFWTKADKCPAKPTTTDRPVPTVKRDVYKSTVGADVVLYSLDNGNHMWPGGVIMPGKDMIPVQDIPATDLMWDFFKTHTRQQNP